MMQDQATYDRNYSLAVSAALFLSLVFPRAAGPALLLLGLWVLMGGIKGFVSFRFEAGFVLFLLLYLGYAIGTVYTHHPDFALESLVQKLSLVVIPVLFSFPPRSGAFRRDWLVLSIVFAVTILSVYGIAHATYLYVQGGGLSSFTTVGISPVHHPTYFMCFWIVGLFGGYIGWRKGWQYFHLRWFIPFALLGLVFHVLSLSLAGMLYLMLSSGFFVLYLIHKKWGWKASIGTIVPLIFAAYLTVNYVPIVKGQWNGAKTYAEEYAASPNNFIRNRNPWTGSEDRLILWIVSSELMSESPMGYGTRNFDEVIYKRLKEYGQDRLASKHLNPHNQYFTTGIEIGVIGIVLFGLICLYACIVALRRRDLLLLILGSSLMFHSLFEAMLERQSGIVFYCFMLGVLWVFAPKNQLDSAVNEN